MELLKLKAGFTAHARTLYKGLCAGVSPMSLAATCYSATLSANLGRAPMSKFGQAAGDWRVQQHPLRTSCPRFPRLRSRVLKPLDFSIWYALMGPAKLPADVVARITADVQRVLADPQVRSNLSLAGVEPVEGSASDLARLIQVDRARYVQLAKSANIKAD